MARPDTLVLDRTAIVKLVTDVEFYITAPSFLPIKDQALALHRAKKQRSSCKKCQHLWPYMRPPVDAFMEIATHLKTQQHADLGALKKWLGTKHNRQIEHVRIYYRASRNQVSLIQLDF